MNGNLALSRAIGDFSFKGNKNLTAEEQIITGNTYVVLCSLAIKVLCMNS